MLLSIYEIGEGFIFSDRFCNIELGLLGTRSIISDLSKSVGFLLSFNFLKGESNLAACFSYITS